MSKERTIKRYSWIWIFGLVLVAGTASAQDATIINARIVVGDGPVIDNGSIVVRNGKIVSVAAGAPSQWVGTVIDARGMTATPGFVDGHKHIASNPMEKEQMADLIENGFTTVLCGGGSADSTVALAQHIESGVINGPRVLPSAPVNLRGTPGEARQAIKDMAAKGIKYTGEIGVTPEPGPSPEQIAILQAAVDEGKKAGVQVDVHAVSTPAMVSAAQA